MVLTDEWPFTRPVRFDEPRLSWKWKLRLRGSSEWIALFVERSNAESFMERILNATGEVLEIVPYENTGDRT